MIPWSPNKLYSIIDKISCEPLEPIMLIAYLEYNFLLKSSYDDIIQNAIPNTNNPNNQLKTEAIMAQTTAEMRITWFACTSIFLCPCGTSVVTAVLRPNNEKLADKDPIAIT